MVRGSVAESSSCFSLLYLTDPMWVSAGCRPDMPVTSTATLPPHACMCARAAIRFVLNDVNSMRVEERQQLLHVSRGGSGWERGGWLGVPATCTHVGHGLYVCLRAAWALRAWCCPPFHLSLMSSSYQPRFPDYSPRSRGPGLAAALILSAGCPHVHCLLPVQEGAGHALPTAYVEVVFDNSDGRFPVSGCLRAEGAV